MKSNKLKSIILIAVLTIGLISGICVSVMATAGSDTDPLISLSYINDTLMPQIKAYVDEKISGVSGISGNTGTTQAFNEYKLVELSKGQTVIGGKSCEMILRQGNGTIIATQKGGIADVTAGVDLANGVETPSNHLMIVPFDDGRGISMATDGILMIKGTYTLR